MEQPDTMTVETATVESETNEGRRGKNWAGARYDLYNPTLRVLRELDRPASISEVYNRVVAEGDYSPEVLAEMKRNRKVSKFRDHYNWIFTTLKLTGHVKKLPHRLWELTSKGLSAGEVSMRNIESTYERIKLTKKRQKDLSFQYKLEDDLENDPLLKGELIKQDLLMRGKQFRLPGSGRIDLACEEKSTGELTSVELKINTADDKAGGQACKYRKGQEEIKGRGKAGRVLVIAPGFDHKFWSVVEKYPEIQAFKYIKGKDTLKLVRVHQPQRLPY